MQPKIDYNKECRYSPLELLNLYYSNGKTTGNKQNKLWLKMNELLTWENILERGYQTDLCPLLYFIITKKLPKLGITSLFLNCEISKTVPDNILENLKNHYQASLMRNMLLLDELKQIVLALEENNIRCIVLKGGYLSEHIYENIASRPMGDLDILIREEDRGKSYTVVETMGFKNQLEYDNDISMHLVFSKIHVGVKINLEVHHRLSNEVFPVHFAIRDIWGKKTLPIELNLVYLAWHMFHHGMKRLVWLCDLAELVKQNRLINWEEVNEKCLASNAKGSFRFAITLLNDLLCPWLLNGNRDGIPFHSCAYLARIVLFKVQKTLLMQNFGSRWEHVFSISLIKKRDLLTYLPRYALYQLTNRRANRR